MKAPTKPRPGPPEWFALALLCLAWTGSLCAQNTPPGVNITSPANGAAFPSGSTLTLTANASDFDGAVAQVEFFEGANKLGEDATIPYRFAWSNLVGGSYQLTARAIDNGGLIATSAIVNITVTGNGAPSITTQPQSQSIKPGSNVTFSVTATGTAPLTYQWRVNDTNVLPNATNPSLTLTNVQTVNEGGYSIVMENEFGSITSPVATLTVLLPALSIDDPFLNPYPNTIALSWSNTNRISGHLDPFPDGIFSSYPSTVLKPYPSSIQVSGVNQLVEKIIVTLDTVSSAAASALDVLLVGPQGQSVLLMSDAGGRAEGVTLTFADTAPSFLPQSQDLVSGSYLPTDYVEELPLFDNFFPPAPLAPSGSQLSVFNGTNPNGSWHLFVVANEAFNDDAIEGGWSLRIFHGISVSISDAAGVEGNSGIQSLLFNVSLPGPSSEIVTVNYATADGTAVVGEDYVAASGQLIFPPGSTNQTLAVGIVGDTLAEGSETFFVNLTGPTNVTFTRSQATGRIIDDDLAAPNDSFNSPTLLTGASPSATRLNALADKEADEPAHAGNIGGKSLWWTWTAPSDGRVTINTAGSSFDTLLGVYVGDSMSALTLVASNDNACLELTSAVAFNTVSNITYRIAVDGANGAIGEAVLNLRLAEGRFIISERARSDFWTTDGPINSILETNGVVYVGGTFPHVVPQKGSGIAVNLDSALPDLDFPLVDGVVFAVAADGADGFYIGGAFTGVGGVSHTNLTHIRADKTVDLDWQAPLLDAISELVVANGQVFVVTGEHRVLGLDSQTGKWTGWIWPDQLDTNVGVYALAATADTLLIGGYNGRFELVGGFPGSFPLLVGLSMSDASRTIEFDFGRDSNGDPYPGYITTLAASCDAVYAAGPWATNAIVLGSGPWSANALAKFDHSGRLQPWYVYPSSGGSESQPYNVFPTYYGVRGLALAAVGNKVYVGGIFTSIGGQPRAGLAALDAATGQVTAWDPNPMATFTGDATTSLPSVKALTVAGNTVYVWGNFTNIAGQSRTSFAALDAQTGQATPLSLGSLDTFGEVMTVAASGRTVYLGGNVIGTRAIVRNNLAAFDAATGLPTSWNPASDRFQFPVGPPLSVAALAASGNSILAGGYFFPSHVSSPSLVSFDRTTGGLTGWWSPTRSHVFGLLVSGTNLFATGGGVYPGFIRAFNAATNRLYWESFASFLGQSYGEPKDLAMLGTTLYLGGKFTQINGAGRYGLAALDAATGTLKPWHPTALYLNRGEPGFTTAMTLSGNTVFVSGPFTSIGGEWRPFLAALDAETGKALPWDAKTSDQAASDLATADDTLYVAGGSWSFGGRVRNGLAALDASTGSATAWNPFPVSRGSGTALRATNRRVYAGMQQTLNVRQRSYTRYAFAAFQPEGAPVIAENPRGRVIAPGQIIELRVRAAGQPWLPLVYQWQFNGTNIAGATEATMVIPNAQPADSGNYGVIVRNGLGEIRSEEALVKVVVPPQITSQPVGRTVAPGSAVVFSVSATGTPPLLYQWRLNGVNILGAYGSTYAIPNAQPTNGGSYSVVVANLGGAVGSDVATLLVTSPAFPFADNLANRGSIIGGSGRGSGNNAGATKEMGESNHVGKVGGRSVWVSWVAPANGIATFSTRGSSFDTLLAIYTGTNVAALTPVAADEDRGRFLTSLASFNAVAGTEYLIVLDGFAGQAGNIVLSWNLDTSTVPFPRILTQPLSLSVFTGQNATFSVAVNTPTPERYQWFFGCRPIEGATNATLTVTNVHQANVGDYHVVVMNASAQFAQSFDATLEIGPMPKVVSQDKLEDLYLDPNGNNFVGGGGGKSKSALATAGTSFVPVSAGTLNSQVLNNTGATTSPGETNHCGVLGGASKWFGLTPTADATFIIDTIGSSIDTVVAVYTNDPGNLLSPLQFVACDNNGAADGIRSVVRFSARGAQDYLVVVDGVNGAQGVITLNWRLGAAPSINTSPGYPLVRLGQGLTLSVSPGEWNPVPSYLWFLNGARLFGASNATINLGSITPGMAGTYTVVVSNFIGSVTSTVATVTVEIPLEVNYELTEAAGEVRFRVRGSISQPVVLQSSDDLRTWSSIHTNAAPNTPFEFLDPTPATAPARFYRATPWREP